MLLSNQINELAGDLQTEARRRPYLRAIIPDLVEDHVFWRLMLEVLEIIVHRRGYVIVERSKVHDVGNRDRLSPV
jgi:hypothetical protein